MKTSQEIVATRSHGLKHFDNAVAKIGRPAVIKRIGEIIAEFANIPNMPLTFGWALRNALVDILKPKGEISMPFNANEALTDSEIAHLETFGMKIDPAREYGPRKKGPSLTDNEILHA